MTMASILEVKHNYKMDMSSILNAKMWKEDQNYMNLK